MCGCAIPTGNPCPPCPCAARVVFTRSATSATQAPFYIREGSQLYHHWDGSWQGPTELDSLAALESSSVAGAAAAATGGGSTIRYVAGALRRRLQQGPTYVISSFDTDGRMLWVALESG